MPKVTYLVGAGASAEKVPVVDKMREGLVSQLGVGCAYVPQLGVACEW